MRLFRKKQSNLLAIFFALLMVLASPISAYAESIFIESQGITVRVKEKPTEAVLVDERGLFTTEQVQQIEEAGKKLKVYDIGLYVEMTERSTCSQQYANQLAEEKYADIMNSKENGVMIVFAFYADAEGYYAVHYNVQGNLSEREISNTIQKTYHEFKTDSEWIAGSFDQVVDYLTQVEYNLINADQIAIAEAARRKQESEESAVVMRIFMEVVAVVVIVYLGVYIKKSEAEHRDEVEKLSSQNSKLENSLKTKKKQCAELNKNCTKLREWKLNAKKVNPEIEDSISEYLAKEKAFEFDSKHTKAESFEELDAMLTEYQTFSKQEKGFVTVDVTSAKRRHEELAKVAAEEATRVISEACNHSTGSRHDIDSLNKTMNYYNGLPQSVRILIAMTLINNLKAKQSSAESDYRRHRSSMSSHRSSSSSSYNSHGGFHSGTFGGGFRGGH